MGVNVLISGRRDPTKALSSMFIPDLTVDEVWEVLQAASRHEDTTLKPTAPIRPIKGENIPDPTEEE